MPARDRANLRICQRCKAARLLRVTHGMLQHIMYKRSEQRRVKFRLLPWLQLQPILQEIRIPAARKAVNL